MQINNFNDHELIFLGTGGGRVHCVNQYRRTGGIIYRFNGIQAHIDPGPGAIVYLNQKELNIDRLKTKYVIVTHGHTDHCNDVPVIIESIHRKLTQKTGTLISTHDYILQLNQYYKDLLENIIEMQPNHVVQLDEFTKIRGTKIVHGEVAGFGIIFEQSSQKDPTIKYKIAFTSDTEIFPEYASQFNGVDILVANILRPDDKSCPRHTSVDQIIPEIKKIHPKALIMTHFGAFMDPNSAQEEDIVSRQADKIKKAMDFSIKVIGAQDNQRIRISDLL